MEKKTITLEDVRKDWRVLDEENFQIPTNIRLVSHEKFMDKGEVHVEYVSPGKITQFFIKVSIIYWLFYAIRLFRKSDANTVIIINGGVTYLWVWCGIIKSIPFFKNRTLFCWDVFVEYILGNENAIRFLPFIRVMNKQKEAIARFILSQYDLNIVWSEKQISTHAKHFSLPEDKFIFLPFKANHSKSNHYDIPIKNYIFAGGNGKRDYRCLIDAVRGTDIPLIISATDPIVRGEIENLPNVIVLGAPEPAFAKLQAASRFVVIPMIYSGLKGGGEANFCNAMWHRKPIIAVDSMSAYEYVVDGETGYIVEAGDSNRLREKIIHLWNNPELCEVMGNKGSLHVKKNFTHEQFISRLLFLALICGKTESERK